jgi:hypothetical protein
MMPEDPPDPSERDELRRLLDGFAAPGRVRRLQDRQQPRRRGWLRRLGRRWWQWFFRASRRR